MQRLAPVSLPVSGSGSVHMPVFDTPVGKGVTAAVGAATSPAPVPPHVSAAMPVEAELTATLRQRMECPKCQATRDKEETFMAHSLDLGVSSAAGAGAGAGAGTAAAVAVAADPTLECLLAGYFGTEERDLRCERCGGDKVHVTPALTRLPRTLVLHLKRFEFSPSAMAYVKNAKAIAIPTTLDVAPYCATDGVVQPFKSEAGEAAVAAYVGAAAGGVTGPPDLLCPAAGVTPVAGAGAEGSASRIGKGGKGTAAEVSPDGVDAVHDVHGGDGHPSPSPTTPAPVPASISSGRMPGTCYILSAVVRHHGTNTGAGHYTADVKRSGSSGNGSRDVWERCDDERIGVAAEADVLADRSSSYLLMYTHASLV